MRMIILHGPCNLVFMHPRPPFMHVPLLLHLSPFLPVTQQVSDSQSLFNFVISSFPSHFSSTAWFTCLSQSCCCFSPFCFDPILLCSPSSLSSSGCPCLGLLHCTLLTFIHFICKWDIRDEEEGCQEAASPPASLFPCNIFSLTNSQMKQILSLSVHFLDYYYYCIIIHAL